MVRLRCLKTPGAHELAEKTEDIKKLSQGCEVQVSNLSIWLEEVSRIQDLRSWKILFIIFGFVVFIRLATGLGPYSGYGDSPLFGDYEAQRHWLEITYHLPITQWYFHDLSHWGLDYPPLTAFHSKILGYIAHQLNPEWVALYSSRGLESPELKVFMRLTVLISDILVFFSGAVYFCWPNKKDNAIAKIAGLTLLLVNPCFSLIDHGHFQYNCVMLGFALWAFGLLREKHYLLGAWSFCMSLGFKQMALFYALPVFFYLLGQITSSGFSRGFSLLVKVGTITLLSLGGLLAPFALAGHYENEDYGQTQLIHIFRRVLPIGRGLYEDKVANFWCAINVVVKLRSIYSVTSLARLSAVTTLLVVLPSCLHLVKSRTTSAFTYSSAISSLTFFLFGFQVHEKTILLPMLPLSLLSVQGFEGVWLVRWFTNIAVFSMYPLLKREGLSLIYWSNLLLWNTVTGSSFSKPISLLGWTELISSIGAVVIIALEAFVTPPPQYPDLPLVVNILYATPHFLATLAYLNWKQWQTSKSQAHIKVS